MSELSAASDGYFIDEGQADVADEPVQPGDGLPQPRIDTAPSALGEDVSFPGEPQALLEGGSPETGELTATEDEAPVPPAVMPPIMPGRPKSDHPDSRLNPIAAAADDPELTPEQQALFGQHWSKVEHIARDVVKNWRTDLEELEEAILDGNFGLVKAIKKGLDHAKAHANATTHSEYVAKVIRGEILKGMRRRHGRVYSTVTTASGKKIRQEKIARVKPGQLSATADSLDRPVSPDSDTTLVEITPGPAGEDEIIEHIDFHDRVRRVAAEGGQARAFLARRFDGHSNRVIGDDHDISFATVSRTVRRAWFDQDD